MKTAFIVMFIAMAFVVVAGLINAMIDGYCSITDEWNNKVCELINNVLATIAYLLLISICILAIIFAVNTSS